MPRVSVVIPAHNAARFLADALASVDAQDYDDLEIVVVDDGSTDATAAIAAAHPRTITVRQPQSGPATARNVGVARSSGELIAFLDADDAWCDGKLQAQVRLLDQTPDAVAASCLTADWDGGPTGREDPLNGPATEAILRDGFVLPATVVVRRSAWDAVGGFDAEFPPAEDFLWLLQLSLHGPFVSLPDRLVRRRVHADNLSRDPLALRQIAVRALERFEASPGAAPFTAAIARSKAERLYLIGRALLSQGDRSAARTALARSRRAAPDFVWQCRALELMAQLPRAALLAMHRLRAGARALSRRSAG